VNAFERAIGEGSSEGLWASDLEAIQVNVGLRCNQACRHCHLEASPARVEEMAWPTMDEIVGVVRRVRCPMVDVTGGAPELHPLLRRFIDGLRAEGAAVQVRTNLTALLDPGREDLPAFFRDRGVRLVASLPCYLEENVRAQRGEGVYERSIEALRRLNALGYGHEPALPLDLVYNPCGAFLPPEQAALEADYRRELGDRFGIFFTRLLAIANMPIGRFLDGLGRSGEIDAYRAHLRETFNPSTVDRLMCRHQVSIAWDGRLYDCDFNLALGLPVDHGAPDRLAAFDPAVHAARRIVTGEHCFGCTAGSGSSCGGALA